MEGGYGCGKLIVVCLRPTPSSACRAPAGSKFVDVVQLSGRPHVDCCAVEGTCGDVAVVLSPMLPYVVIAESVTGLHSSPCTESNAHAHLIEAGEEGSVLLLMSAECL
jgi:hypothetical protein